MIYTFLISVVFIAEIIIAIAIVNFLLRIDKEILAIDSNLAEMKPSISEISGLVRKISEQIQVLSEDYVEKIKNDSEEFLLRRLSKFLMGFLVLNLNFKIVKRIRKSKLTKTLVRGFNLLENMV